MILYMHLPFNKSTANKPRLVPTTSPVPRIFFFWDFILLIFRDLVFECLCTKYGGEVMNPLLFCFVLFGGILLCSGLFLADFRGSCVMLMIEPGLTACRTSVLCAVIPAWPWLLQSSGLLGNKPLNLLCDLHKNVLCAGGTPGRCGQLWS